MGDGGREKETEREGESGRASRGGVGGGWRERERQKGRERVGGGGEPGQSQCQRVDACRTAVCPVPCTAVTLVFLVSPSPSQVQSVIGHLASCATDHIMTSVQMNSS